VQKSRKRGKHKASPLSGGEAGNIAKKIKMNQRELDEDGTSSDQLVLYIIML